MIGIPMLLKFLKWANLGLYHKNNPLSRLEMQDESAHYKINEINENELSDVIFKFNKKIGEPDAEQIKRQGE